MIYIASLAAFGKKALGDKIFQTKINKIIEQLTINPKVSGMNSVILGPKDLSNNTNRIHLTEALHKKHEDILVIYLYTNDKEQILLEHEDIIKKQVEKRINLNTFKETVTDIYENLELIKKEDLQKRTKIKSIKVVEPMPEKEVPTQEPVEEVPEESHPEPPKPIEKIEKQEKELPIESVAEEPIPQPEPLEDASTTELPSFSTMTEERIKECINFSDWDLFKRLMTKDTIVSELMLQNDDYAHTINMLSNLDQEIVRLFKDGSKTVEERFEGIKDIGIERSNHRVKQHHIIAHKIESILTTITISAETLIHNRLQEITSALDHYAASDKRLYHKNKAALDALIEDRVKLQFELHELSKNLIIIYKSMDETVQDIIESFDKDQPSDNTYINEVYATKAGLFSPVNGPKLASKLMSDLQKNRVSLSALDNLIQEVVAKVFYLCEVDESIITHQQKLIQLLESQNVEDVVIVDSILKNALRLYVGPHDVGTRSTTITWAGILSRRQNTLLIDLSGQSKFRDYGITPITLEHFLENRIEEHLLCVEGQVLNPTNLMPIILELKKRLNYYPYINIILDASQVPLIQKLAEHTLSITFITDCTNRSNALTKKVHKTLDLQNIARKIVLIEPTMDEMTILEQLDMDPLTTKLISLPYLSKLKSYAIKGQPPYLDPEIRTIYEEAFR